MKIRPLRTALFHVDRQTDTHTDKARLIVAFHYVGNAPKNTEKTRMITSAKKIFPETKTDRNLNGLSNEPFKVTGYFIYQQAKHERIVHLSREVVLYFV